MSLRNQTKEKISDSQSSTTAEEFRRLYIDEQKSFAKARKILHCGPKRAIRLLKRLGIPKRTRSEASLLAYKLGRKATFGLKDELNPKWTGGRVILDRGYVGIKLSPSDFFFAMANHRGYVYEHRLVMAKYLNRCLLPWEVVHHKNRIRDDNRLENLQLLPHPRYHIMLDPIMKKRIIELEKRVTLLEAENAALREHLEKLEVHYD